MIPIADDLGAASLYLLYAWLISSILSAEFTNLKAYGERPGLAAGLLLAPLAVILTLAMPPRMGSLWQRYARVGDAVAAMAALVLLIMLFFKWYEVGQEKESFFQAFDWYDVLLPLAGLVAFMQMSAQARGRAPDWLRPLVVAAGVVALVMTVVAITVGKPDGASLQMAPFIALVASIVVVVAAMIAFRERAAAEGGVDEAEIKAEVPHPRVPRQELLGGLYERFFADSVLDYLIAGVIGVFTGYILSTFVGDAGWAVGALAGIFYPPLALTRVGEHHGQTFGMQIVGLRVLSDEPGELSFRKAFVREVILKQMLTSITFGIFYLVSGWIAYRRPDRKALWDSWTGTIVVRAEHRWIVPPDGVLGSDSKPLPPRRREPKSLTIE